VAVSRDEILAAIRREAAANGGQPPAMRKFTRITGIGEHEWKGHYWARWNDALTEAGYSGRQWGNTSPLRDLSATEASLLLATMVREYGHFPTGPELMLRKRSDPASPHPKVFTTRLGNIDAQRAAVYSWAVEHPGWEDVAEIVRPLLRSAGTREIPNATPLVVGYVYLFKSGDYFKVGRSNNVGRRAYEVALQLPERTEVLHSIETDDPEGIEAYWHRRFASSRANGEWFKLTADDVAAFMRRKYQ